MYNYHHNKLLKRVALSVVIFIGLDSHAMGFDLSEQIYSKFQTAYNKGFSDSYILSEYSPKLSKDPYGEAISSIEDRSTQVKVAGAQYIEQLLQKKGCNLSKKQIWGILYYFVPEFRSELARSLKQKLGDYDSNKYVFDNETIEKYCKEYFICESFAGDSSMGKVIKDYKETVSTTPADVMTSCKEFFQANYKLGQDNKEILQEVEVSQAGAERYWNNSTEDSPYDIMADLAEVVKLLYQDVQEPITPALYKTSVSYKMPNFSNNGGGSSSSNGGGSSSSNGGSSSNGNQGNTGGGSDGGGNGGSSATSSDGPSLSNEKKVETTGKTKGSVNLIDPSLEPEEGPVVSILTEEKDLTVKNTDKKDDEPGTIRALSLNNGNGGYDKLVNGLNMLGLNSKDPKIFSNLCEDTDDESEPEEQGLTYTEVGSSAEESGSSDNKEENVVKFSELSDEEYQEIVDSMLAAVDQYTSIPKDLEEKIMKGAGTRSNSVVNSTTASELDEATKKIKNCYTSCEGLRLDQKASCMLKCSCSEIESPIFDPNKTPGLGPIFVIKFCGVPATNTTFSVGGRRISSIEEGLNEIFGALDKLSREGKLGTWTQQNEFLDSSTKNMNTAGTFAFTISVEFVDVTNNKKKESEQYKEKELVDMNEEVMRNYEIANLLTDVSSRNIFSVIGDGGTVSNLGQKKPLAVNESVESEDIVSDANADRYVEFESYMAERMNQQGELWETTLEIINKMTEQSKSLYGKKCEN